MKKYLLIVAVSLVSFQSYAQSYDMGIGIRGGVTSGITFKAITGGSSAFEGIVGFGFRSVRITGLYEIHKEAFEVAGLNWYYGAGAHVAFYDHGSNGDWRWNGFRWEKTATVIGGTSTSTGIGIDGILGIEYEIGEIPFTVSFDIKPSLEFNTLGYFPFMFWDGAFSIRYVW